MPRILFTLMHLAPDLVGGSIVYLTQIMNHLPKDSVLVLVPWTTNPEADAAFDADQSFQVIRIPTRFSYDEGRRKWQKVGLYWQWFRSLWKHARRSSVDVVVLENIFYQGLIARFLLGWRGIPYIAVGFGEELALTLNRSRSFRDKIARFIYGHTLRHAGRVIVISEMTRELVQQFGVKPEAITIIYPPTPLPEQIPDAKAIEQFRYKYDLNGHPLLATVGRLIRRKGHDHLLEAITAVVPQFPNLMLAIASGGPLLTELVNLTEQLHLTEHVRFLGKLEKDELNLLYAACDLFVMPNRTLVNGDQEGYGIVFNEASTFGKAVIGGRSGGTVESILHEKTGLCVNGDEVDDISAAIIRLLTDRDWAAQLGEFGRQWIIDERSPENAARLFFSSVCTLCNKPYNLPQP